MSVRSDVIVPYEWIVPDAYAKYRSPNADGGYFAPVLFYPNHTVILFIGGADEVFLEWTVVNRTGDSVQLNLTVFVEGRGTLWYTESVPDGKVDILDIATVAKVFGKQAYQWGYDYNADVTEDQKVDIMDIAAVAKAYGTTQDDPKYNPNADIAPDERKSVGRYVVHHKTLLLDIDVYSRETFLDVKPLGKTCFWAEPYADIDDEVVLYGLPPEELIGTVEHFREPYDWPGITAYGAHVFQMDPFAWFTSWFDWHTGMAMRVNLLGCEPIDPDGHYSFNGTEITRYASTPLGIELNVGDIEAYPLYLNSTNVQIGPPS